jgi:hypothetical protein
MFRPSVVQMQEWTCATLYSKFRKRIDHFLYAIEFLNNAAT